MVFSDRISSLKPSAIREIFKVLGDPSIISLAGGNPDPQTFPSKEMGEIAQDIFENQSAKALQYGSTEGYFPLRQKLVERLEDKFSIGNQPDELIIVSGGQQGIELSCKVLCNEGDTVICENPSFIGALNAFRSYNVNLCGIPMEDDGMDISYLEDMLKTQKNIKIIYTIPTFQNPMGVCMSLEKRKAIYNLAKKYNVVIIEDNPYGELRFKGEDIPTIKSMDTEGIVIYCGSFSKILSPGIRLGFVCANKEIVSKIVVAKQVSDVHTNLFFQILVSNYLTRFDIDSHISSIRDLYRQKSQAMKDSINTYFPSEIKVTDPDGGIFLWAELSQNIDAMSFSNKLLEQNVAVVPGNTFMVNENSRCSGIRLNYSMPTFDQIQKAIKVIGETYKIYK